MKRLFYLSVFALFIFSFKGFGQSTSPVAKSDDSQNFGLDSEEVVVFGRDYKDLLTLELATRITGFDSSKVKTMQPMKDQVTKFLRYYWENGRIKPEESMTPGRNATIRMVPDAVQMKWLDAEADMDSFLYFIGLDEHPELTKVDDVGEAAYWNSKKNYLQMYYNGVSFMLQIDMSNEDASNKEKTIALAKLIVEERFSVIGDR